MSIIKVSFSAAMSALAFVLMQQPIQRLCIFTGADEKVCDATNPDFTLNLLSIHVNHDVVGAVRVFEHATRSTAVNYLVLPAPEYHRFALVRNTM